MWYVYVVLKKCVPQWYVVPQYNIGKGNGISLCYIFYNSLHVCIEMCEWCVCSKIESGVARFHMRRTGCQHCCCHTGVPTMYSPVRRSLNAKLMAMFFFSSFFQPFFQPRTTKSKVHRHPWAWDSSHLHQNHRCCCSSRQSVDWRCRHRHHHPLSIESKWQNHCPVPLLSRRQWSPNRSTFPAPVCRPFVAVEMKWTKNPPRRQTKWTKTNLQQRSTC